MAAHLGRLIVIDGADGAGKATQTKLLVERLRSEGASVETLDFPQYTNNTFGQLIHECLDRQHGDFLALDPRITSTLFAADRYESKPQLETWLAEGKTVILDRYVSANMLHQGAKITSADELRSFLGWLDHVEHEVFGLPRPDGIIYLDVPADVRLTLMEQDGGALDAHESDRVYQQRMEERARDIVSSMNNLVIVHCVQNDALRTPEDIHEEIYSHVQ